MAKAQPRLPIGETSRRIPSCEASQPALAAAISRHYSDTDVADTVEQALAALARACWAHEERPVNPFDPFEDDQAARAFILGALHPGHPARRLFEQGAASFRIPRKKTPEEAWFHRTVLRMARCLWETSVTDDTVVFPYLTEVPGEPVDDHPPDPVLFPNWGKTPRLVHVPNWGRTATAIVTGVTLGLGFSVTEDSIRKRLIRQDADTPAERDRRDRVCPRHSPHE